MNTSNSIGNKVSFVLNETLVEIKNDLHTLLIKEIPIPKDPKTLDQNDKDNFNALRGHITAFLNSNGGRIFIGIDSDTMKVTGLTLSTKDKDNFRNTMSFFVKTIFPDIENDEIVEYYFLPLFDSQNKKISNLGVIKLLVLKGEDEHLYSTTDRYYECYKRDSQGEYAQMRAEEIMETLVAKVTGTHKTLGDVLTKKDPFPSEYCDI